MPQHRPAADRNGAALGFTQGKSQSEVRIIPVGHLRDRLRSAEDSPAPDAGSALHDHQ